MFSLLTGIYIAYVEKKALNIKNFTYPYVDTLKPYTLLYPALCI